MTEELTFDEPETRPPSGTRSRFGQRWRLTGAGLANVWRFGDLNLPAASGRLLMRGPNGTGKTTALEALWPFLLDLNPAKLAAGKARPTTLKLLMSEGATSKRRYGYVWLTFAPPADLPGEAAPHVTYGVRLQFSAGASPAVKVVPFTVPTRPVRDLPLRSGGGAYELEEFTSLIEDAGGQVFTAEPEEYLEHLARRVWRTDVDGLKLLAERLREVRNPTLLGEVSPAAAAAALRASLPGVAEPVLTATADALAESEATRQAFVRDQHAAAVLTEFALVWTGHVVEVVTGAYDDAKRAADALQLRERTARRLRAARAEADTAAREAASNLLWLVGEQARLQHTLRAIELSPAYQAAGRMVDLEQRLVAEQRTAAVELERFGQFAAEVDRRTGTSRAELGERLEDLDALLGLAEQSGAEPVAVGSLLVCTDKPRRTHLVAGTIVNPGRGLDVRYAPEALVTVAASWRTLADRRFARSSAAQLALKDHRAVAEAEQAAQRAAAEADRDEQDRDEQDQLAVQARATVRAAAQRATAAVSAWGLDNPDLRGVAPDGPPGGVETSDPDWDSETVEQLAGAEPAFLLSTLDSWALGASQRAERRAAQGEQSADQAVQAAQTAQVEAAGLRQRAAELRAGQLVAQPRPAWAGPGDDGAALGSILEWIPEVTDGGERDRLELALAEAGVLGATVSDRAVSTDRWRVAVAGDLVDGSLAAVLRADPAHPLAAPADAALGRIALARSAAEGSAAEESAVDGLSAKGSAADGLGDALVIGQDGSFRAGVLVGRPVAAGEAPPAASHIGARRRRQAALTLAKRLDSQADEHEAHAVAELARAAGERASAETVRRRAHGFPPRDELRRDESHRAGAESRAAELNARAGRARDRADACQHAYRAEYAGWSERTTGVGLPIDLVVIQRIQAETLADAQALTKQARTLTTSVAARITRAVDTLFDEAELADRLEQQAVDARSTHALAEQTGALLRELRASAGDAHGAVDRHRVLTRDSTEIGQRLDTARTTDIQAREHLTAQQTKLDVAESELVDAQPARLQTAAHLNALLDHPAVAEVLVPEPTTGAADLLARATSALRGRRPQSRKRLGERYDAARAELAGSWVVARGDAGTDLSDLDVIVATHAEREYTPAGAAERATELARRAEAALALAEQKALTDFVIDRLPSAIGTAWTKLQDWKSDVNAKMRSAEASSGVGVQVQIELSPDLPASVRTVYELSCTVSDADRSPEHKAQVGAAIQGLLAAADGETMFDKLSDAVDIRDWVDVHYLVTRPDREGGRTKHRWGSRTGLSGGERRLVVLAPMLAAAAAAYDQLGRTGLRLVPLDEVPAEVDERGREGLARFIAELDLDLLCTSYLWDGSPGAWDGIDAHDLEAASDGTVVSFPMLVRGPEPLPGDEDEPGDDDTEL